MNAFNETINNDLIQLYTWLKSNKLSVNISRTNSMLVSTKQEHSILKNRSEDLHVKIYS